MPPPAPQSQPHFPNVSARSLPPHAPPHSTPDFPNVSAGLLQGGRQLEVLARFARGGGRDAAAEEQLQGLAEVVADGQHHDAITGRTAESRVVFCYLLLIFCYLLPSASGTSMQHVVYDLHKRLAAAAAAFAAAIASSLSSLLPLPPLPPLLPCPLLNSSTCPPSSSSPSAFTLLLYNPLHRSQAMRVRVPVGMSRAAGRREGGGGCRLL